jgi:nucleoside 2-deoxyribosyltransferase
MKVYCAGPLFNEPERGFLDLAARRFRDAGLECFVPHEKELGTLDADAIFRLDYAALASANALFAWLDGPMVDDGTACEIGIFRGLMQAGEAWRKGIVGLVTDLRLQRRGERRDDGVVNLFVAGTIRSAGRVCWSLDETLAQLLAWNDQLERP